MADLGQWIGGNADNVRGNPTDTTALESELNATATAVNTAIQKLQQYGVHIDDYADFAGAANTVNNAGGGTLRVSSASTLAQSSYTTPSSAVLEFTGAGDLTLASGQTLTVDSTIKASPYQKIFKGAGTVNLNAAKNPHVSVHWFNYTDAEGLGPCFDRILAALGSNATAAIYMPAGTYQVSESGNAASGHKKCLWINDESSIVLYGDGAELTKLEFPAGDHQMAFAWVNYNYAFTAGSGARTNGFTARGFLIDQNGHDMVTTTGSATHLFYMNGVNDVRLRDLHVKDAFAGVFGLRGVNRAWIERNYIEACYSGPGQLNAFDLSGPTLGGEAFDQKSTDGKFFVRDNVIFGDPVKMAISDQTWLTNTNGQGIWVGTIGAYDNEVTGNVVAGFSSGIGTEGAILPAGNPHYNNMNGKTVITNNRISRCEIGSGILFAAVYDASYYDSDDRVSSFWVVEGNYYRDCRIGIQSDTSFTTIANNVFEDVHSAVSCEQAFRRLNRRNVVITGNIVKLADGDLSLSAIAAGMNTNSTAAGTGKCYGFTISNNSITGPDTATTTAFKPGISISQNVENFVVSGNVLQDIEGPPIQIGDGSATAESASRRGIVSKNVIDGGNRQNSGSFPAGVQINERTRDLDVLENRMRDSGGNMWGVFYRANSHNLNIERNKLYDVTNVNKILGSTGHSQIYRRGNFLVDDDYNMEGALVAGTITFTTAAATATASIAVERVTPAGTIGDLRVSAKVAGTSVTITSYAGSTGAVETLDTSTVRIYIND